VDKLRSLGAINMSLTVANADQQLSQQQIVIEAELTSANDTTLQTFFVAWAAMVMVSPAQLQTSVVTVSSEY
jgi:alkylhydroperoxidase family enzyme